MKKIFNWLFSSKPVEKKVNDPALKLLNSMRVTSRCRYNASLRLKYKSLFSFFTTTFLSLGLIFIPLLQNTGISLAFKTEVLNALQVFLAVAVLTYSITIGTSQYDMRSKLLSNCADNIKDLTRRLRHQIDEQKINGVTLNLDQIHDKYREICYSSESHKPLDYLFAKLEMRDDYNYTGLIRLKMHMKGLILRTLPYVMPITFIAIEILFISDMLGYTSLIPSPLKDV